MYVGKIVELGQTEQQIFTDPEHPYICALLAAVPDVPMNFDLDSEVADASRLPPGCSFHPRCPRRSEPCDKVVPALLPVDGTACRTACHLYSVRGRLSAIRR